MRCLLYIISPTHVISSFSALKSLHQNDDISAAILVHWPGVSSQIAEEIRDIVKRITIGFPFVDKLTMLTSADILLLQEGGDVNRSAAGLRSRLGYSSFDQIFYAHDIEGGMLDFLCTAYPESRKICFGDAFGNVYEKSVHLSFLKRSTSALLHDRLIMALQRLLTGTKNQKNLAESTDFKPHEAVLILPVDQSGNFLRDIPLTVCPKHIVQDVINHCASAAADLKIYIENLVVSYNHQNKFLLLTDNISEGKFMDFEREIDMYCSIIKKYCTPGSVVFLKSHPGEALPRNEKIKARLGTLHTVVELDQKFKRYPIELWKELIFNCTVICMSYPVLSLKYLYDINVIQPMDDNFVEQWFPEWTWASYKNAITLYMEPLKNLASWDGSGVLWAGNIQHR
jgi:hypothetical protein